MFSVDEESAYCLEHGYEFLGCRAQALAEADCRAHTHFMQDFMIFPPKHSPSKAQHHARLDLQGRAPPQPTRYFQSHDRYQPPTVLAF